MQRARIILAGIKSLNGGGAEYKGSKKCPGIDIGQDNNGLDWKQASNGNENGMGMRMRMGSGIKMKMGLEENGNGLQK